MLKAANCDQMNVQAVKTVKQSYVPTPEALKFLDDFRKMINEAIRIALAENVTSQFSITSKAYSKLASFPYPTAYRLSACNIATGILRNYRQSLKKNPRTKKPYAVRPVLRIWIRSVKIENGNLRLSLTPNVRLKSSERRYVYIPLTSYVLRIIQGYTVRSVTLTACTLSIAFSKETAVIEPTGLIGIDRNLDNVTTANLDGKTKIYDLSRASMVKQQYYFVRSRFKRNDNRIRTKIYAKYGRKQRNKVQQVLHSTSKAIVAEAKKTNSGIIMENLKGLRKLYRKGNGQGVFYRGRMNGWSYFELQRQVEYKARWLGIPVTYVKAAKTSSRCAICGCEIVECTQRKVWCGKCQRLIDRDENAALNIVKQGVILAPVGFAVEAMVKEPAIVSGTPNSRCEPMTAVLGSVSKNRLKTAES